MSTTVNSSTSTSATRTLEDLKNATTTASTSLGKDEFLKILVMQLANQDPLDPASDTDYISQLAQFSSLEQMQSLNSSFTTSQAYDLLGKYVYLETSEDSSKSNVILGKVDGVIKQDGIDYLVVGGEQYELSQVTGVLDVSDTSSTLDEQILQSANLIGKTVSATVTGDDGTKSTVTGAVTKIVVKNGSLYALVDDQEIQLSDIEEINA
jgi:flagellar basal-body rod modification protein FlgD